MLVNNSGGLRYRNAFLTESEHIVTVARAGGGEGGQNVQIFSAHHLAQVSKVD